MKTSCQCTNVKGNSISPCGDIYEVEPTMKRRNQYLGMKWCMSQWIVLGISLILRHSESVCTVSNCIQPQCSGNTCHGCKDGFYLYSGSCIQCYVSLPWCVSCSSRTSCTKCNDGYYLQSGLCKPCPDRCFTCTSSTQCTTCKDTYWNWLNGCNSYCPMNCLDRRCNDTVGFCYSCVAGKYGLECQQDCNLCKDGQCDLRKCTNGCKDGYYQENTISGFSYCYKCVYDNCLTCSNGTYCTHCEQGYYRNYHRQGPLGRGNINCLQCYDSCMDCSSTEYCHEDCIQNCSEPVNPGTTKSAYESTTIQSTTSKFSTSKTEPPTQTQKTTETIKSTESTPTEDCHYLNGELYKELNSYQQQIKTCCEGEDQLTFGHGFATGFGVAFVLFGSGLGIAIFIRRQTKQHKHADGKSEGHHEYVNTNMTDILSVISPDNNEVNNDIHTVSSDFTTTGVTNIVSSRDYVMLADRHTHESDYTDLQNT